MTHILTILRSQIPALPEAGCWGVDDLQCLQAAHWQARQLAEHNEAYLQPITYLLLRNASAQLWCYQRRGGDARLDGSFSCGVGGHVHQADVNGATPYAPSTTLRRALLRELHEELGASATDLQDLRLHGLIYEGLTPVGRVHVGVLFTARWLPAQQPQEMAGEALRGLGFCDAQDVADNPKFELWSRLAAQHLLHAAN